LTHVCRTAGVNEDRSHLLRPGHDPTHRARARRGFDGLFLELSLDLGHPVLHLLLLLQHLHGIFHSVIPLTRVTRPSNRRTTSRTKGSSSGLTDFEEGGDSAFASFSRYSTLMSGPSHARTSGSRC